MAKNVLRVLLAVFVAVVFWRLACHVCSRLDVWLGCAVGVFSWELIRGEECDERKGRE
jgi:hypothetical protein